METKLKNEEDNMNQEKYENFDTDDEQEKKKPKKGLILILLFIFLITFIVLYIIKYLTNENKELQNYIESLKEENKYLKEEIKELKNIIAPINKKLKETIKNISVIMKENEFDMINFAIKTRLNKDIKEIKKLYQATIDGDDPISFHSKCDNIPNTLTIIKSSGKRRFGGFTTEVWESTKDYKYKDDKNAFLFSLDKQKIYPYNNDGNAIWCFKDTGPTFGLSLSSIYIGPYSIKQKNLWTNESHKKSSYNFFGDNNALSEDGKAKSISSEEIEVFQIIV